MIILAILLAFGLTGCSKESGAYSYDVYFTNSETNKLVTAIYKTDNTDTLTLINELLDQMNTERKAADVSVVKKDGVNVENCGISNNIAYIYYNQEYYGMDASRQALYRCAVVKTLTQIDEVDFVMFFVNNIPAVYADGTTIGMMAESDFIDETDTNINNLTWADLNLYFANSKGDKLVKNTISVAYSRNISIERVIVEQLIKGPDGSSLGRTLPETLKLLNVSVKDGICYVNLDSTFLTEIVNVSTSVPIYSIVNSLCELENVDKVQILINGDSNKDFRESISLESPFLVNNEIVSQ